MSDRYEGYATAAAPPESAITRMEHTLDACIQRLGNLEVGLERASDRLYGATPREATIAKQQTGASIAEPLARRIESVMTALERVERAAVRLDHGN